MREIRFRAWYAGKMNYNLPAIRFYVGNVKRVEINHDDDDFSIPGDTWFDLPKDDGILMQYTGLKDKNGKEIYEGDVVRANDVYGQYDGQITWWEDRWTLRYKSFGEYQNQSLMTVQQPEVIGNIYETPQLLQGQIESTEGDNTGMPKV